MNSSGGEQRRDEQGDGSGQADAGSEAELNEQHGSYYPERLFLTLKALTCGKRFISAWYSVNFSRP